MPPPNLFDSYDTVRDSNGNCIHHHVVVEMARIDGQGRENEHIFHACDLIMMSTVFNVIVCPSHFGDLNYSTMVDLLIK